MKRPFSRTSTLAISVAFALPAALVVACSDPSPSGVPTAEPRARAVWSPAPADDDPAGVTGAGSTGSAALVVEPVDTAEPSEPPDAGPDAAPLATKDDKDAGPKDKPAPTAEPVTTPPVKTAEPVAPKPPVSVPPAAPGTADAVAEAVDSIYVPKQTFSANFAQQHMQKVSGVTKDSKGVLYVEKPNKLSFRYETNKNRIVSDGKILKIYVADDQQMIEQPVGNSQYPGALAFLMGNGIRPSFTFTFNEAAQKNFKGHVLVGKPRTPTPHYESVLFYVDKALLAAKDANCIRRVLILDAQGNRNRFDFTGAKQPAKIDPSEWVFTPPAGTNIVKNNN